MKQAFILLLSGFVYQVSAQNTIPNPGFENWVNGGTFFSSYQDPQGWGTINSATSLLGVETVKRDTNPQFVRSGNAAIKLETFFINLLNRPAQGICVTGSINIDTEEIEGGFSYNLRPDYFSGWYQYYPAGTDTGQVAAILTKWNLLLQQRDIIGVAGKWILDQTSVYQEFEVPFEYWSNESPDTLMVVLVSSSQFEPSVGSVMYIDDLSLNFTTSIQKQTSKTNNTVYPNPASGIVYFESPIKSAFEVRSLKGSIVSKGNVDIGKNSLDVKGWKVGFYMLNVLSETGDAVGVARIVVTE